MQKVIIAWLMLLAVSMIILFSPEPQADLRIGVIRTVDAAHPFVAQAQGFFKDEGLNVIVYSFGTSPPLAEAIASGEIDIAYMSFPPAATWISKGTKMKIVSGASRGGDIVCVREVNATGKIAVSKKGTMTENIYRGFVKEKLKPEFEPIYGIEPPDMPTALLVTEDVDAVLIWEPFATKIEDSGGACIFDVGEEWKKEYGTKYQRNILVATDRVLSNKTMIDKILRVHNRTIDFLNSPQGDAAIAEAMGIAPLKKRRMEYNSSLDWPSMVKLMEMAKAGGYLKEVLSKEELIYGG